MEDLNGIERIWLIFHFHVAQNWKSKVFPPRGDSKISLFATRSPHRPNPIGLSCVKIIAIQKRTITIKGHDLIDGTPIFDIKPYISFADSFPKSPAGWIDQVENHHHYEILWSDLANEQINWLGQNSKWPVKRLAGQILSSGIRPSRDRIRKCSDEDWELACKSWRLRISKITDDSILIKKIYSGYSNNDLNYMVDSAWDDMDEHRSFNKIFESEI